MQGPLTSPTVYEGAFVLPNPQYQLSNPPYPTALAGAGQFAAASGGCIQGRFGWGDPSTGLASNVPTDGATLGVVVPRLGRFATVFYDCTVRAYRIRQGLPVTIATGGPFWLRFPGGAVAGNPCYADPVDGHAVSGNTAGAVLTQWTVTTNAGPGELAIVSSSAKFGA
jgi:hypothetical protein